MQDEIWMPVPSKDGIMASNHGRVKLPSRVAQMPHGGWREYKTRPVKGTITRASKTARYSYYGMYSRHFGNLKVHRLVCEAFHGAPPDGMNLVIHLDENGLNNRSDNLRWGTQKENLNASGFIEYCKGRTGGNSPTTKGRLKKLQL